MAKGNRFARAKAGLRRAHGAAKSGMAKAKPILMAAGTGAAFAVADVKLSESVEAIKTRWYAMPAIGLVGAFLLAKKNATMAHGLAGAAGYAGYLKWAWVGGTPTNPVPKMADTSGPDQLAESYEIGDPDDDEETGDLEEELQYA